MVGVFRRWLGVTTLRKIKAEWRKTDVWCTISSPWYVDVVVPQIHRKWRHRTQQILSRWQQKSVPKKAIWFGKDMNWRCPPPPHFVDKFKFFVTFSFAKSRHIAGLGAVSSLSQNTKIFHAHLFLESWIQQKKWGSHVSNIFPNLYSMTFHYIDWFIVILVMAEFFFPISWAV